MGRKYVIVGGSAAGMAAAHTIRKKDRNGNITVLSNEKAQPYFRPMIPYIINGKKRPDDIFLSGSGIFTQGGISVKTGFGAKSIDFQKKTVTTASGEAFLYDKILFSSGSTPYLPENIEGLDSEGVFSLKTLSDAQGMAKRSETATHVVMLGGGILNLKAAFALLEKKLSVTMVVYSPEVLSQLMDPKDAFPIRNALDNAGLNIITGISATQVLTDSSGVCGVALDNGSQIACQMVCVGKGVVPDTGFLNGNDIKIDKGIFSDPYTQTSIKDAYTAGDVAVAIDPVTGEKTVTSLWTHAVEMGICAGLNMTGSKTVYTGTLGIMNATQVADVPLVSMGIVHTKNSEYETHAKKTRLTYRKIVFSKDGTRLIGALFIGDIKNAGIYRYVIREKKNINGIKSHLINHTVHYGHFMQP
ncbi:MAG: FAD-dependent oxidoreductase [Desulfobacteraceae bacterium]|nr:FAD-dependent oxidoreductase [Desulfobacteraceae bacterium]